MNESPFSIIEHHIEAPLLRFAGQCFVRPCCQIYNVAAEYERLAESIEKLTPPGS